MNGRMIIYISLQWKLMEHSDIFYPRADQKFPDQSCKNSLEDIRTD